MTLIRRDQTLYKERLPEGVTNVAAIAATTRLPLRTYSRDFIVDLFEIEVPGGYTSDAANYYDISLQTKPMTFTAVAATDICTATGHNYSTGDAVQVTNSGGALPAGLSVGVTYFAVVIDANTFKLSDTNAHAVAGTNIVDITGTGTGTQSVAKVFALYSLITVTGNGDLVTLVFATATRMVNYQAVGGVQLDVVCTKFASAVNIPAGSRFMAHVRAL